MKFKCNFLIFFWLPFLFSCSVSKQISHTEDSLLLDSVLQHAHVGISIYDPSTGKYIYQHDADKYFVPASNTKLFTLYAGMKYLGDSLPGLRYQNINDTSVVIYPTGDPTFLHPAFPNQPVYNFLKNKQQIRIVQWDFLNPYGPGWAWEDHQEDYMVPRTAFPIYGNLLTVSSGADGVHFHPKYFIPATTFDENTDTFLLRKTPGENSYQLFSRKKGQAIVPFQTDIGVAVNLLKDTLHNIVYNNFQRKKFLNKPELTTLFSQPVDSVFKFMMYNSDNFFAEQTLLMVSNEKFGYMADSIINTLLKNDFNDIPQKPRWVDGSGLSRYNLFTPNDFIYILQRLNQDFGWKRISAILPTGNQGTLKKHFSSEETSIHAKTGSMGNIYAISGYLQTKSQKQLIFSIIINNYIGSSSKIRLSVEQYIQHLINNY